MKAGANPSGGALDCRMEAMPYICCQANSFCVIFLYHTSARPTSPVHAFVAHFLREITAGLGRRNVLFDLHEEVARTEGISTDTISIYV